MSKKLSLTNPEAMAGFCVCATSVDTNLTRVKVHTGRMCLKTGPNASINGFIFPVSRFLSAILLCQNYARFNPNKNSFFRLTVPQLQSTFFAGQVVYRKAS